MNLFIKKLIYPSCDVRPEIVAIKASEYGHSLIEFRVLVNHINMIFEMVDYFVDNSEH